MEEAAGVECEARRGRFHEALIINLMKHLKKSKLAFLEQPFDKMKRLNKPFPNY